MRLPKSLIASPMHCLRLDAVLLSYQRQFWHPFLRAVNYHDVPASMAGAFEMQLRFYRKRFQSVDLEGLLRLLAGHWPFDRPGLILSFDDGLRSHADVVAPLLGQYGFTGWFMVPGGFLDAPADQQAVFAQSHRISHSGTQYGDCRLAMSWGDLRALADQHVIGCHTWNHTRLRPDLGAGDLDAEIVDAKSRLEAKLNHEIRIFAWVGGEEWSYSAKAAAAIRRAGYAAAFMTNAGIVRPGDSPWHLQRANVEASYQTSLVGFQLSGLLDLAYWPKRRRVNRLTSAS